MINSFCNKVAYNQISIKLNYRGVKKFNPFNYKIFTSRSLQTDRDPTKSMFWFSNFQNLKTFIRKQRKKCKEKV